MIPRELRAPARGRPRGRPVAAARVWLAVAGLWVSLLAAPAGAAPAPARPSSGWEDLPPGHRAYSQLERLIAVGLVEGYEEGAFRRGLTLSRYELALAVGKALEKLRQSAQGPAQEGGLGAWVQAYNARQPGSRRLSEADVRGLAELTAFLREELEVLGFGQNWVGISGEVRVSDRFTLRAGLGRPGWQPGEAADLDSLVASVSGTWRVSPQVEVSGEVLQNSGAARPGAGQGQSEADDRLYRLGARIQLGPVRLDAGVQAGRTDLAPDAWPGRAAEGSQTGQGVGMGVAVTVGDTVITADRGQSAGGPNSPARTTTSVGVQYVSRPLAIRAEHRAVDLDELARGTSPGPSASRTAVGVDIAFPRGSVSFGYTVEGRAAAPGGTPAAGAPLAGSQAPTEGAGALPPGSGGGGAEAGGGPPGGGADAGRAAPSGGEQTTRTANVGITYRLSPEASLLLGYRLIDFSGSEPGAADSRTNIAMAQLTIRF